MRETLSRKNRASTLQDCLNLDLLDLALQSQACNQIHTTMTAYNASGQPAKIKDNEIFAQDRLTMVRAHMQYILFHVAKSKIEQSEFQDPKVKQHLILLIKIFALDTLINQGAVVFDSGFFAPGSYQNLQKAQKMCIE